MNQISQLLSNENIVLDLDASSKKRVFEHVGLLFENNQGIARSTVFDSLFAREKLGSTGLGRGIAIPHGRIKGLKHASGAFLRLATPVPFDSPDGIAVSLLFVLLVPEQATEQPAAPEDLVAHSITVRCKRPAGIWRGGRFWPAAQVTVSLDHLTDEQIARIVTEPLLDFAFIAAEPAQ